MGVFRIALIQARPASNLTTNRVRGEELCDQARSIGADLALFPEMWSTGYAGYDPKQPGSRQAWEAQAVRSNSPFVMHFRELAAALGMAIGITYLERGPGRPRNSISVFDRHGELAHHYSKVHTCEFDWECALEPGDGFRAGVLDTRSGPVNIGAMICFDREFPESARLLMLEGAEIILTPNACEMEANRMGQFRARAMENMVGVALANYAGPENLGHSVAFDGIAFTPDEKGRDTCVVEAGEEEGIFIAAFDMDRLRDYRQREAWGNAYRRPRLYSRLVSTDVHPPFVRPDATR
jgi:predicted amidohydrolase